MLNYIARLESCPSHAWHSRDSWVKVVRVTGDYQRRLVTITVITRALGSGVAIVTSTKQYDLNFYTHGIAHVPSTRDVRIPLINSVPSVQAA